jgi:hypothetical protein
MMTLYGHPTRFDRSAPIARESASGKVARHRLLSLSLAAIELGEHVLATAKRLLRSSAGAHPVMVRCRHTSAFRARRPLAARRDRAGMPTESLRGGQLCEAIVENAW